MLVVPVDPIAIIIDGAPKVGLSASRNVLVYVAMCAETRCVFVKSGGNYE